MNGEKNSRIENCLLELLKETKEMKQELIKHNYHVKMESADISSLFPFETNAQVNAFMKQDQEWEQRRKESLYVSFFLNIHN